MNKKLSFINLSVIVVALGYFVDIFDLTLFNMLRVQSLKDLGVADNMLVDQGIFLLNCQMFGMLVGGVFWGVLGDKKGRMKVLFASIIMYSVANLLNAFVTDIPQYAVLRFISGVGLAGELGAGITLIAEILPKENRGMGTTLVATIGVLGATFGGLVVELFSWRVCYIIGGVLGLLLLFLRYQLKESMLFNKKESQSHVQWGSFIMLFTDRSRFFKFLACVLIGVPIWYVAGLVMAFSPELAKELSVDGLITSSRAIGTSYLGLAVGDFLSGFISQKIRSRKKAILLFMGITILSLVSLFNLTSGNGEGFYYFICFMIGVGAGFWAIFVTVAAEQFGTNIRATVATSVPNFVRGAVIPMTLMFKFLKSNMSIAHSMYVIGVGVFALALISTLYIPETFSKELDYLE